MFAVYGIGGHEERSPSPTVTTSSSAGNEANPTESRPVRVQRRRPPAQTAHRVVYAPGIRDGKPALISFPLPV
jgi:hypothetical protein